MTGCACAGKQEYKIKVSKKKGDYSGRRLKKNEEIQSGGLRLLRPPTPDLHLLHSS
jgi:hypothetical protein